jgi:hypothetical protein
LGKRDYGQTDNHPATRGVFRETPLLFDILENISPIVPIGGDLVGFVKRAIAVGLVVGTIG